MPSGPDLGVVRDLRGFVEQLRSLKVWAGNPSVRELARRVSSLREERATRIGNAAQTGLMQGDIHPVSVSTVGHCFTLSRQRLDIDLVADVLVALGVTDRELAEWVLRLKEVQAPVTMVEGEHPLVLTTALPPPPQLVAGRHLDLRRTQAASRVVMFGLPGIGKTTLALANGHAWLEGNRGAGSVFLRLPDGPASASVTEFGMLFSILRFMGVEEMAIPTRLDHCVRLLSDRLEDQDTLIVIDGAGASNQLRWTAALPSNCRLLVTSRRRLHVPDAVAVGVPPLSAAASVAVLRQLVKSEASLGSQASTTQIARHARGIPLVLHSIASDINDRQDWGPSDHLARLEHGSNALGAEYAVATSYARWTGATQLLFALLADWPGHSLSKELAGVLLGDNEQAGPWSVLVEESVLANQENTAFVMHDMFAAYGHQVVVDTVSRARRDQALTDGAAFYVRLATEASSWPANEKFHGAETLEQWWHLERTNVARTAVALLDRGCYTALEELAEATWLAYDRSGDYSLGVHIQTAAQTAAAEEGDVVQPRVAYRKAMLQWRAGDTDDARALLTETLANLTTSTPPTSRGDVLNGLAIIELRLLQYDEAVEHLRGAATAYETAQHVRGLINVNGNLGLINRELGRLDEAEVHYAAALELTDPRTNPVAYARTCANLGDVALDRGDFSRAAQLRAEAARLHHLYGGPEDEGEALAGCAVAQAGAGLYQEAVTTVGRALRLVQPLGSDNVTASVLYRFGDVLRMAGHLDAALVRYNEAAPLAAASVYNTARIEEGRALIDAAQGRLAAARKGLQKVRDTYARFATNDLTRVDNTLVALQ